MKNALLLIFICSSITLTAQTWEWANSFPGINSNGIPSIKSDGFGNSYTLQMDSGAEVDVVKRNPSGDTIWNNTFLYDVGPSSYYYKLAVDDSGNSYLAMSYTAFPGDITYGSNTLSIPYSSGIVLVKLDSQGNFVWQQDIQTYWTLALSAFPVPVHFDLELTANNDVLLSVSSRGNQVFEVDNFSHLVQSKADGFFLRLSNVNGGLLNVNHVEALGSDSGVRAASSIQISDGGYCISGAISGIIDLNGTVISSDAFDPDFFIAKFDSLGNLLWHKVITTDAIEPDLVKSMNLNAFSNEGIAITGSFNGYIAIDGGTTFSSSGTSDCYAAKYSNDGDLEWAQKFTSPAEGYVAEARIDENDRLYLLTITTDSIQIDGNWVITGPQNESGGLLKLNHLGEPMYFKSLKFDPWDSELGLKGINGAYIGGYNDSPNNPIQLDTISLNLNGTKFIGKIDESACGSDVLPMPFNDSTICLGSTVDLTPTNNYDDYNWSTGEITNSIQVADSGSYYLTAYNTDGCAYTSEPINIFTATNNIIPEICLVTVDDTSSHNIVVWDKPLTTEIDSFRIYRQAGANYYYLGSRAYDSISQFVDTTAGINPNITSYRYKVSSVDQCGNESALGAFHETMHLTVNQGTNQEVNLIWDTYEGFSFQYYYIYRDVDDQNNWMLVDSVSFLNFTYTDYPPASDSTLSYMVTINTPGLCSAEKAQDYNSSRSNKPRSIMAGDDVGLDKLASGITIYPNPAKHVVNINSGNAEPYDIEITNLLGTKVRERHNVQGEISLNIAELSNGVYMIDIDSNGHQLQYKLVVAK